MNIPLARSEVTLIGRGLYSVSEAARLADAPPRAIRRWLHGYRYRAGDQERRVAALWRGDIGRVGGVDQLSFLDMLESRVVAAFRRRGVTWPAIREAAERAREMYDSGHPFTVRKFLTDGRRIFSAMEESGTVRLFDLNRAQYAFHDIVAPSLFEGVEYANDRAVRWLHPAGHGRVVVDPARSFGRPVLAASGVPTDIVARAARVEEDEGRVAKIYRLTPRDVRAAVAFESRAAA